MIRTVCLNPALDKTVQVPDFKIDAVSRITESRIDAGGKGINVSKVIRELGGTSVAYALVAGAAGRKLEEGVRAAGIDLVAQHIEGETRTNLKVVDSLNHTNTDINEPGPKVRQVDLDELLARLISDIEEGDTVVLAGSLPSGAPVDTYASWTAACKVAGARVFLDADGAVFNAAIEVGPTLVKPNDHELAQVVGRRLSDIHQIEEAAHELMEGGVGYVVVSMGGEGALFVAPDKTVRAHSPKVKVGSTVGAGDSVVAAIAYALDTGLSLEDTIRLSMATGAANVMQSGTQAAPRELVDSLINQVTMEEL